MKPSVLASQSPSVLAGLSPSILANRNPSLRPISFSTPLIEKPNNEKVLNNSMSMHESDILSNSVATLEVARENFTSSISVDDTEIKFDPTKQSSFVLNSTSTYNDSATSLSFNISSSDVNFEAETLNSTSIYNDNAITSLIPSSDVNVEVEPILTGSQAPTEEASTNDTILTNLVGITESTESSSGNYEAPPPPVNVNSTTKTSQGWIIGFFLIFVLFSISTAAMLIHLFMERRHRRKTPFGSFASSSDSPDSRIAIADIYANVHRRSQKPEDAANGLMQKMEQPSIISEITEDFHDTSEISASSIKWAKKKGAKTDNSSINFFDLFHDELSLTSTNNSYAVSTQLGGYGTSSSVGAPSVDDIDNISQMIPSICTEEHCKIPENSEFEEMWNESFQYDVSSPNKLNINGIQRSDIANDIV